MTRTLPALHEGHAPYYLQQAFSDAVDAFEDWLPGRPEPRVEIEGRNVPISAIFGRMRSCFDLMPGRVADVVCGLVEAGTLTPSEGRHVTYANAAMLLRARCVDRLKRVAAAFDGDQGSVSLRRVLA